MIANTNGEWNYFVCKQMCEYSEFVLYQTVVTTMYIETDDACAHWESPMALSEQRTCMSVVGGRFRIEQQHSLVSNLFV